MFEIEGSVLLTVTAVVFVMKAFALIDCVARPQARFTYLGTLPKRSWLILLGLSVAAHLVWLHPLSILNLVGTVASLVYLAQVRGSDH